MFGYMSNIEIEKISALYLFLGIAFGAPCYMLALWWVFTNLSPVWAGISVLGLIIAKTASFFFFIMFGMAEHMNMFQQR